MRMTIIDACELMKRYAVCPKCGCEYIGNGKGSIVVDTEVGHFYRNCNCGWEIDLWERKDGNT